MTARKKVDAARMDLAQAEAKLQAARARENEAIDTPGMYEAWRRECADAAAEVERCSKLLEREEAQAEESERAERRAARRRAADAQNKANAALARRTMVEGRAAVETLLALLQEHAKAQVLDTRLNAQMDADEEKIVSADTLARFRAPLPREDVSETRVTLWVFEATGAVIGDQDAVREIGEGVGKLNTGRNGYETTCVKREFRQVEYREAEPRQQLQPLFSALRIPHVDRPGWAWNAREHIAASAVLDALERRDHESERPVLTELIPVEPWSPKTVPSSKFERAGDI